MRYILKHETKRKYLVIGDTADTYQGQEVTDRDEATRFPTEAAAIVALEDSDFCGTYIPQPIGA